MKKRLAVIVGGRSSEHRNKKKTPIGDENMRTLQGSNP